VIYITAYPAKTGLEILVFEIHEPALVPDILEMFMKQDYVKFDIKGWKP